MGLLGLFKKEKVKEKGPQWVEDMKSITDSIDGFKSVENYQEGRYIVDFGEDYRGVVCEVGDGNLLFTLKLDNLRDLARKYGMSPEVLYDAFTVYLDFTSVAVDKDYEMFVSTVLNKDNYDYKQLAEVLCRWPLQVKDYKASVDFAVKKLKEGVQ